MKHIRYLTFLLMIFVLPPPLAFSVPDDLNALEVMAWTEHDEFLPEVESKVVRVIQLDPSSAHAHYILSHIFIRKYSTQPLYQSLVKKALELAQQALELAPQQEYGYVALSHVFEALGLRDNAKEILDSAPAQSWRLKFSQISLALGAGYESNTLSSLESLVREFPESRDVVLPFLLGLLADSLEGKALEAALIRINEEFHHNLSSQALALRFIETETFDKSEALFRTLLEEANPTPELKINYAIFLSRFRDRDDEAKTILLKSLNEHIPNLIKSIVHSQLGVIALKQGQTEIAAQSFLKALQLNPDSAQSFQNIVDVFIDLKKLDAFQKFWTTVDNEFPGRAGFYAIVARIYSDQLNLHNEAIEYYQKAITLEPENSLYYNAVGLSFYHLDDYPNALHFFDQAIALDPTDSVALYNKACIYSLRGLHQLALNHLKKAILINPSLQEVARVDKDFEKIANLPLFKKLTHGNP